MRASMAAGGCFGRRIADSIVESSWGDPHGAAGMAALAAMAVHNGGQNKAALKALDLKPGHVALEIGCGPGMALRAAMKRVGRAGFVAGIDRSACAVHMASHVCHDALLKGRGAVLRAEAADLPFRDLMFDRAFAVNSFQYWSNPARALREIGRVLAPRGRLVLTQRATDSSTNFPGAADGMDRITQAVALLKAQGWRIIDERGTPDGGRLLAVSVAAEPPTDFKDTRERFTARVAPK